jgi:hypothetical protein
LALLRRSGAIPKWLVAVVLILALITAGLVGFTVNLGGQIRHTEIRDAAGPPSTQGAVHLESDRD